MSEQLHPAQIAVLSNLRHAKVARFSELMRPTGLQSDTFKFHLRKLLKLGYVEKLPSGEYRLTPSGKEFANNLDETKRSTQRQPKLSMLAIVKKPGDQSAEPQYLFQKRLRNPFFGFWGCISGPVQWGETAEHAAARELFKQTRLTADCVVHSFHRQYDFHQTTNELLEDKLFIILEAQNVQGELSNAWYAGYNEWMTLTDFKKQDTYFATVPRAIEAIENNEPYTQQNLHYSSNEY